MEPLVLFEVTNRVGYITLNRPAKRNALNFEFVQEIKNTFERAEQDETCKVIVLQATGDAFCAGADLAYLQQLQQNTYAENLSDSEHLMHLFKAIYTSKKIVIAQVNGAAIAGGSGLATVCDFCFATPHSTFGYTEVKIGFVPAIVMVFLVRKVSEKMAKQLLLTGDVFEAQKALEFGLINEIVPADKIAETVFAFAQKLCVQTSAQSTGMVKEMLAQVQEITLEEGLQYAANMNAAARNTEDCKKGIAAFLTKQKLTW
jgi:methylglutaconyl-CoA hydratase